MYRIMLAKSKKSNFESLYQFMTTTTDGVTVPLEIDTKEKLDKKIEKMLNCDGYSKRDFIVVEVINYSIDATNYSDGDDGDTGCNSDPDDTDDTGDTDDAGDTGDTEDTGDDNGNDDEP